MLRTLLVAAPLVLALGVGTAHAGDFCGVDADDTDLPTAGTPTGEPVTAMTWIEAFAKSKAAKELDNFEPWLCAQTDAVRLRKRIVAACTTILARDGEGSPCVTLLAAAGVATLGTHDIYALVVAAGPAENPVNASSGQWHEPQILGKLGDPRGARRLVDKWTAAIPEAGKREKSHAAMVAWSSWRQAAAHAIGVLGGADEATFLREQAAATKDKFVSQACLDAAAAIDKRKVK